MSRSLRLYRCAKGDEDVATEDFTTKALGTVIEVDPLPIIRRPRDIRAAAVADQKIRAVAGMRPQAAAALAPCRSVRKLVRSIRLAGFLTAAATAAVVAGCGATAAPTPWTTTTLTAPTTPAAMVGWLAQDSSRVMFLQFVVAGADVRGTYTGAGLPSVSTVGATPMSGAVSGTVSGSTVVLTFLGGTTATGNLNGESLTLAFPASDGSLHTLTFVRGTVYQYNGALLRLQELTYPSSLATDPPTSPPSGFLFPPVQPPPAADCPGSWELNAALAEWTCWVAGGQAVGTPVPATDLSAELSSALQVTSKAECDRYPDMYWYSDQSTDVAGNCRDHQ